MFRKLALSLLDHTFGWIEHGKSFRHRSRRLPRVVVDELVGLCLMWPLFRTSFDAPMAPKAYSSDATLHAGCLVETPLSPE